MKGDAKSILSWLRVDESLTSFFSTTTTKATNSNWMNQFNTTKQSIMKKFADCAQDLMASWRPTKKRKVGEKAKPTTPSCFKFDKGIKPSPMPSNMMRRLIALCISSTQNSQQRIHQRRNKQRRINHQQQIKQRWIIQNKTANNESPNAETNNDKSTTNDKSNNDGSFKTKQPTTNPPTPLMYQSNVGKQQSKSHTMGKTTTNTVCSSFVGIIKILHILTLNCQ